MNGFDEKLIDTLSRLQKGEKEYFSSLDSSFFPLTASLAAKYGKGDEYDDSLQSARMALYNAAMSYNILQQNVSFGLYAKICISNALISDARKRKKKPEFVVSLEEMTERGVISSYIADEFEDPSVSLIKNEEILHLKKMAGDCLSAYEKQVFDLYVKGMSTYEISSCLEKDEKSVNNALCRITAKLKGLLK